MNNNEITSAYLEGAKAATAGKNVRADNPHAAGTEQHKEWRNGYFDKSSEMSYAAADAAGKF